MKTRTTLILSSILILAALLAGALLWSRLPEQIPSHWNVYDQVDGYSSRLWGVLLMPLISLGMLALFLVVPSIDPLKANIAKFRPIFNTFILFIIAFMLYVHVLTLLWALGFQNFKMSRALLPFMGLLFILVGWMMRSAKRNFFIGIRTPWTLSSDRVWDQTHRVGSVLFMLSGVVAVIGSFFGGLTAFWLLMAPLMACSLFLVVYSYVLYQRETKA
jgi:uncharacterized membrane protein